LHSTEVAIVLPPKEGFAPEAVGAIGLLVERLVRAGAEGVVLGRANAGPTFLGIRFAPIRPGFGLSRASRYAAGVARAVRRIRPALIEVHNWPEIALRLARLGRPVTLILNNDPQSMRGARTAQDRERLLKALAGVATSSEWLRQRLLSGVVAPVRAPVVLPNCIDVPPPPPLDREKLILFAGRMVADKGADAFVAACAEVLPRLPGWRAEMIGADRFSPDSPETPFLRGLRPKAAAAGVVLRGHQPNPVVMDAMRRAAIVAAPSRWAEPFGLVALEAMASGAALVCSPRGGLPEVAGDTALYADPDRPGALAEAFLTLALDEARRTAMAAAGRLRAEGFGAPAAARRLLAFRRAVLG
jgi:UDP-glucose:(glucosyl)LPS alpha-1,2-glucosyltransferase